MAARNIGVLVVLQETRCRASSPSVPAPRVVFPRQDVERDAGRRDKLTTGVITVDPGWTANRCMALMTEKHIRHLPVLENGKLVGVISIGDVVRAVVDEQKFTTRRLPNAT